MPLYVTHHFQLNGVICHYDTRMLQVSRVCCISYFPGEMSSRPHRSVFLLSAVIFCLFIDLFISFGLFEMCLQWLLYRTVWILLYYRLEYVTSTPVFLVYLFYTWWDISFIQICNIIKWQKSNWINTNFKKDGELVNKDSIMFHYETELTVELIFQWVILYIYHCVNKYWINSDKELPLILQEKNPWLYKDMAKDIASV